MRARQEIGARGDGAGAGSGGGEGCDDHAARVRIAPTGWAPSGRTRSDVRTQGTGPCTPHRPRSPPRPRHPSAPMRRPAVLAACSARVVRACRSHAASFSGHPRSEPASRSYTITLTIFGVPTQALFGQLLIGLINGAFYALLSLGLSVIFGLLNIINFTHGAQYMMGAFAAYFLLQWAGLGYWWALLIAPIVVGITGIVLERTTLKRLYQLDHLYGLLLTFGFALIIQGLFRHQYGSSGLPYSMPGQLTGGQNLGFMFLPHHPGGGLVFFLAVCF